MRIKGNWIRYTIIIASLSMVNPPADASWWDKAKSLLKQGEESQTDSAFSATELGAAFREALRIGSDAVVSQLGKEGGFNADPAVRIPLPRQLQTAKGFLERVGMGEIAENLELRLNRAAEEATPKAQALFREAISELTFEDVKRIYNGPKDSATQYFREKMTPELIEAMQPIIENSLTEVGAVRIFNEMMEKYNALPYAPKVNADLNDYVMQKTLDGIFLYLAREEAAIREDPVRQTTELLKRVFG